MQVHLLNSTSPKQVMRQLGRHHLQLCMIAIQELRKTWFGAEVLSQIFSYALQHIEQRRTQRQGTNAQSPRPVAVDIITPDQSPHPIPVTNNSSDVDYLSHLAYPFTGDESLANCEFVAPLPLSLEIEHGVAKTHVDLLYLVPPSILILCYLLVMRIQ